MKFENACNCIVDYSILEKAIKEECSRRNITPKDEYKIYLLSWICWNFNKA